MGQPLRFNLSESSPTLSCCITVCMIIYIYENPYGDMIGKYAGNLMECGYDGNMLQIVYFM